MSWGVKFKAKIKSGQFGPIRFGPWPIWIWPELAQLVKKFYLIFLSN